MGQGQPAHCSNPTATRERGVGAVHNPELHVRYRRSRDRTRLGRVRQQFRVRVTELSECLHRLYYQLLDARNVRTRVRTETRQYVTQVGGNLERIDCSERHGLGRIGHTGHRETDRSFGADCLSRAGIARILGSGKTLYRSEPDSRCWGQKACCRQKSLSPSRTERSAVSRNGICERDTSYRKVRVVGGELEAHQVMLFTSPETTKGAVTV